MNHKIGSKPSERRLVKDNQALKNSVAGLATRIVELEKPHPNWLQRKYDTLRAKSGALYRLTNNKLLKRKGV